VFIVTTRIDRKLPEYMLTYTWNDEDISINCPVAFSTKAAAMDYVGEKEDVERGVYCMIFEEQVDYPFDIPVVYNGKFDRHREGL